VVELYFEVSIGYNASAALLPASVSALSCVSLSWRDACRTARCRSHGGHTHSAPWIFGATLKEHELVHTVRAHPGR
jgi:hypothetical protein